MINRRQFFSQMAGFSVLLGASGLGIPVFDLPLSAESLPTTDEIRALEARLRPGEFSWYLHNELRHQYLAISERISRQHADIILRHSIMDDYILQTLSDWHLNHKHRDAEQAITVLLHNADQYVGFVHLRVACLIKAGDVFGELWRFGDARRLYNMALNTDGLLPIESLAPYHTLARLRLTA